MTKIAIVQLTASTNKEYNLKKIISYVKKASKLGASLIAFPEFMMFYTTSNQTPKQLSELAETISGNFVKTLSEEAKRNSIEIVGTIYEKSKTNRVYDTAFIINKFGKVISVYRKIHLYDALGFKESSKLIAGKKISKPTKTRIGNVGLLICYDLRFPEMSRSLASSGSEILIAPSAWVKGESKEEHWLTINKTRAIENGCYIIAPDQVGHIYCGRSLVVDPFGKILVDMKKKQGIAIVEISSAKVHNTRKVLPLLKNRRIDIYKDLKI